MLLLLSGCAKTITVTPPPFEVDSKLDLDIPFTVPLQPKLVKLVPRDGQKAITQDNVSVEVASVVPANDEADYIVSVTHPMDQNKIYQFQLFPMLLKLKITNKSDHIITLTKTIVKLEDSNQNDYPMMNTMSENKQRLSGQIMNAYKPFTANLHNMGIELCKKKIKAIAPEAHAKLQAQISKILKEGNHVRKPDTQEGYFLNDNGIQLTLENYEPEIAADRVCEDNNLYNFRLDESGQRAARQMQDAYKQLDELSQRAVKQMQDALFKINEIPNTMKNAITNGVYQPINILPGRAETIVVPFGPRKEGEEINFIHVGIFDLPTRVDDAGNPIKRAHFNFDLVAEK